MGGHEGRGAGRRRSGRARGGDRDPERRGRPDHRGQGSRGEPRFRAWQERRPGQLRPAADRQPSRHPQSARGHRQRTGAVALHQPVPERSADRDRQGGGGAVGDMRAGARHDRHHDLDAGHQRPQPQGLRPLQQLHGRVGHGRGRQLDHSGPEHTARGRLFGQRRRIWVPGNQHAPRAGPVRRPHDAYLHPPCATATAINPSKPRWPSPPARVGCSSSAVG